MNKKGFKSQTKHLDGYVDSSGGRPCQYPPVNSLSKSFYGSLLAVMALLINFSILNPAWAGSLANPPTPPFPNPDSLNLSGVPGQTVSGDFLVEGSIDNFPVDLIVSGAGGDVTPNPITLPGNVTYRFTIPETELLGTTLSAEINFFTSGGDDVQVPFAFVSVTITVEEPLAQLSVVPDSLNLSGFPEQTVSGDFLVEGSFPVDFSVSDARGDVTPNPITSPGNVTYSFTIPDTELPGTILLAQISLSNTVSSDPPSIVSITITVEELIVQPTIGDDDTPETANQLVRDSAQTHNFERQGDEDWFTFAGEVNENEQGGIFRRQFSIRLFDLGSLSTPIVEVYDTDGEFLMLSIDTRDFVDDTVFNFIVPVDGNYFVRVFNSSQASGLDTRYSIELTSMSQVLSARVEGTVIDAVNNQPLEGVIVSPKPNGLNTKTDASGTYFTHLNLGTFNLEADLVSFDRFITDSITIETSDPLLVNIALTPTQVGQTQIEVDSSFSGSWFDPTHNGEGFLLEILADNKAVIYWFTYDTSGNQAWIQGSGDINGNTISITNTIITSGGIFGPDFDPNTVVRTAWGSITFTFNDCNTGAVSYTGLPEFGSGSLNLQRLTSISGLECGQEPRPEGQGLDRITGSWFDLTHDGEGYVIEIINSNLALIYWFSYDTSGNQAWFFETGDINGNTITVTDAQISNGGIFGSAFDPNDVVFTTWGSFTFTFNDCGTGTVDYTGPLEFGSDSLNLVRLSTLGDYDCNFFSP